MISKIIKIVSIGIKVMAVIALIASGLTVTSSDSFAQSPVSYAAHSPDENAEGDSGSAVLLGDECHTCSHVVVPTPAANATLLAMTLRWEIRDQQWVAISPPAETPPPRPIGNEAFHDTSIPIIEVNHVSLCTDRVHRAPRSFERTG
jgi:hypothetical protein